MALALLTKYPQNQLILTEIKRLESVGEAVIEFIFLSETVTNE